MPTPVGPGVSIADVWNAAMKQVQKVEQDVQNTANQVNQDVQNAEKTIGDAFETAVNTRVSIDTPTVTPGAITPGSVTPGSVTGGDVSFTPPSIKLQQGVDGSGSVSYQLPELQVQLPHFELPKIELPKIELPTFRWNGITFTPPQNS